MQDDDLKDWYKSSFEAIKGKPVPDVWDMVQAELPPAKSAWRKRSLLLALIPVLAIITWWIWPSEPIQHYYPRELADLTIPELSIEQETLWQNTVTVSNHDIPLVLTENNIIPDELNPAVSDQLVQASISSSSTNANGSIAQTTPEVDETSERKNTEAFHISSLALLGPELLQVELTPKLAAIKAYEKEETVRSKYFGINMGLYNVTMLNNNFVKAMNKESLMANEVYIKPSYSLFVGTEVRPHTFLELNASLSNLGQAIGKYEEGTYSQRKESRSYVSLGAGILRFGAGSAMFTPYYGGSLEGRFLANRVTEEVQQSHSNWDIAMVAKGGFKTNLSEKLAIGVGLTSSISILNTAKSAELPSGYSTSRNAFAGLDLRLIHKF